MTPTEPGWLRRTITESRRRRVFRVAAAYAAGAWLLIEVASVIVPVLLLPEWITRAVVLSVLVGFPLAIALAWVFDVTPSGIRRARPDAGTGMAPDAGCESAALPSGVFTGFVAGAVIASAALFVYQRIGTGTPVSGAPPTVAEIELLARDGNYAQAYKLAVAQPDIDDRLQSMWPLISDRVTILTQPPGAKVTALGESAYANGATDPVVMGVTPMEEVRVAREDHVLRIELDGYEPVERLVSSALRRVEAPLGRDIPLRIEVEMVPIGAAPGDAVAVPGGAYELVSPDLPPGKKAHLDDFFIDRYEVDNDSYRKFIQQGGYRQRELWQRLDEYDDAEGLDAALGVLVDRTGLPGPRGWSGQLPPSGQGRHPVTGVSWFEASAYCRSHGKRLPTAYQWEKAARAGQVTHAEGFVMPWGYVGSNSGVVERANFSSDGPVEVDAHPFGISPFGAYAMAGNVKEWLLNSAGIGRLATGGSWDDPGYLFSEFGSFDPMTASSTIGFRCATVRADDAGQIGDQGRQSLDLDGLTPEYTPVDEEGFANLLAHYRYDSRSGEARVLERLETPVWIREKLEFAGPGDEQVIAYLWLPTSAPPPYQTLLFVPGAGAFFGRRLDSAVEDTIGALIRSGRAAFAVVMKGMTERAWGAGYEMPAPSSVRFRDVMVQHATEMRLGIDYLATRDDIALDKLAYVAVSWGAGSRLGFAAVDDRFSAVVFIGGGIDERLKPTLPEADNVNFAPYIRPPKLLINGRSDEEHPWLTRALPLWNLLQEPKQKVVVEGAGHVPSQEALIPAVKRFLDETFGPVQ